MGPTSRHVLSQNYGSPYPTASPASLMSGSTLVPIPTNASNTTAVDRTFSLESGTVVASDNVINQVADKDKSLYQICLTLRMRLSRVPGFDEHLTQMDEETDEDGLQDPVHSMWKCFQRGYPLMTVYNALRPAVPLTVDPSKVGEAKRAKTAAFRFLQACMQDLKLPATECFILTDLYGSDTTGFVKVTKVVNRVLDIAEARGLLLTSIPNPECSESAENPRKRTHREYVVDELVVTERKYVQDLEVLQQFKKQVEERGVIAGDAIHDIFLNLNALLDFQRRFLIRIEQMNSLPEDQQHWGRLFTSQRDGFGVYEPYIANQKRCEETAMREFEKLRTAGGSKECRQIVESPANLTGFLLKPFQRLSKYPLLLKELRDKGDLDNVQQEEIVLGIAAATSVLERTNAAVDREARVAALSDLRSRVEDWKGHDEAGFGELLLYGTFTVVKNDAKGENEREYIIYLFERILLCCKETNPNKQKNKIMGTNKQFSDKMRKAKLTLKGRIHMQNVTDVVSSQKPGSYAIQMFWKGDPGVENFLIRYSNEEMMKKWYKEIMAQHKLFSGRAENTRRASNDFTWMQTQGVMMQNPYMQEEEAEEEDSYRGSSESMEYSVSSETVVHQNGSTTSLRSRSTTGDSNHSTVASGSRHAAPRLPPGHIQASGGLTLHTQIVPSAMSPAERMGQSYFSPTAESPISSRTSSSSGMYPFPRQGTPNAPWHLDEHNRFPTPPLGRTASREAASAGNGHMTNGRAINRPSLPAMANQNIPHLGPTQNRTRSASSPDIHNSRRLAQAQNQPPVPDVPAFPAHIANLRGPVNRSESNSPTHLPAGLPIRPGTQSPGFQRERLQQQQPPALASHDQMFQADRTMSPAPAVVSPINPIVNPTQVKIKVTCGSNYVTLVVHFNIAYQSLIDRIDAKLSRFTTASINGNTVRIRYHDEDGDLVTIQSDEDVQIAFTEWKEQHRMELAAGQLGEIQFFCHSIEE